VFPDIGETVNDDGIVCAFRKVSDSMIIGDLAPDMINDLLNHDIVYKTIAGSKVIDIDVNVCAKSVIPFTMRSQIQAYNNAKIEFCRSIVKFYEQHKGDAISMKLNTLFSRSLKYMAANNSFGKKVPSYLKNLTIERKKVPVNFAVDITLMRPFYVTNGFKLTGRDGGKGVVPCIRPTEDMPVDEFGIRADVLVDPMAISKRTIPGRLHEISINRTSDIISKQICAMETEQAFEYVVAYHRKINKQFGDLIAELHKTPEQRAVYVEHCKKRIYNNILPSSTRSNELFKDLAKTYGSAPTPVTFNIDVNGRKKQETTEEPIMIGSMYIMVLFKIPAASAAGVGYVNKFNQPVNAKNPSDLIKRSSTRFGEDEFRMMITMLDAETVQRIKGLYAVSPKAMDAMVRTIITAKNPSNIRRIPMDTADMHDEDMVMAMIRSYMECTGVDVFNTLITDQQREWLIDMLEGGQA
jgi:DNA-directed RNA polymerase beta subunit